MIINQLFCVFTISLLFGLIFVFSSPVQNDVKQRTNGVSRVIGGGGSGNVADFTGSSSQQQQIQKDFLKRKDIIKVKHYNVREQQVTPEVEENLKGKGWTTTSSKVKGEVPQSIEDDEEESCTKCQKSTNIKNNLTDTEIRQMRIDEIKDQILRKLRMENPPNVTIPRSMLPAPLMEGEISFKGQMNFPSRNIEDFYGKMEQVIVMTENENGSNPPYCQTRNHDPAACFYFKLTDNISDRDIESAELWAYKLRDRRDRMNQTYEVSEFVRESQTTARRTSIVAISETDIKSGWIKIDLAATIRRWLSQPRLNVYGLEISCKTCAMNLDEIPVSYDDGEKPFIVIILKSEERVRRERRSIDCNEGTTQCCRESLYVNFTEIGWNDWIVQPAGYYANYCKGSCVEDITISLSTSHHTTVMQVLKYLVQKKTTLTAQQKALFSPCCTPTRMTPISLIYQDDNKKVLQNNLPNMVVESCGCY